MATPLASGALWLYAINTTLNSQRYMNTFVVRRKTPASEPDYVATANLFLTTQKTVVGQMVRKLRLGTSNQLGYDFHTMQPIYPARYTAITQSLDAATGDLVAPSLPGSVALTVTLLSVNATRWGRGSKHIAGMPNDQYAGGLWTAPALAFGNGIGTLITTGLDSGDFVSNFEVVLWSHSLPARVTPVTSFRTETTVRTMSRRVVGRGI